MKANQVREFRKPGVLACVILAGSKGDYLGIDKRGMLVMPPDVEPKGFHLVVAVQKDGRTFVVQKNVGTEGGGYESHALSELEEFAQGFQAKVMRDPIDVITAGEDVWTGWHKNQASNRIDLYHLANDGQFVLFQVGIFTHDKGRSWKLHGESRWCGRLYMSSSGLVAVPEHHRWGAFEGGTSRRTQIFGHPEFVALLKSARLEAWTGSAAEVDPPLPEVPGPGYAVVQWYITFAGQSGQGPVNLYNPDGSKNWVHGIDIEGVEPDPDGEVRVWRGDTVSFTKRAPFGSKPNSFKLLNVRLVKRSW